MRLKPATLGDARLLFDWRNEPATCANSINTEPILWNVHYDWLKSKIDDPKCQIWLGMSHGMPVGVVRLDYIDTSADISITVAPDYRGMGYGTELIKQAVKLSHATAIYAKIKPSNKASQSAFTKAGFCCVGNGNYLFIKGDSHEEHDSR